MCESVCGTPPVRTFAVFFFERYAKMWTQRKRRRVVPLWYEKDQTKNTKKGWRRHKKGPKKQYNFITTYLRFTLYINDTQTFTSVNTSDRSYLHF